MPIAPKVVYSPGYDIHFLGLEKLHPFDSCKYSRAWQALWEVCGDRLQQCHLVPTAPASVEVLQTIHTDVYLTQLKQSRYVAEALSVNSLGWLPINILDSRVLKAMRLATTGTVIAAESALDNGLAVNLAGGYHHASCDRGEGFCIYADVAIAIASLRQSGKLATTDNVVIIDLDAHQGNGVERIFAQDSAIHILDMYNGQIYPQDMPAKAHINCDLPIVSGTRDQAYLSTLKQHLPNFLQQINHPKIAFYNAGTDIYELDTLGQLKVSWQGVLERDRFVFQTLVKAGIPWVMVLSGGYTQESYKLVAESVAYILQTWGSDGVGG